MQLFILILVTLNLFPSQQAEVINESAENGIVIEIVDAENLDFQFTMKYEERRKMIKVRSEKPIKSLRTVDAATSTHRGYNVAGSELIFLPKSDFPLGSHVAEFKFENSNKVVLAKIHVTEPALVNG
ncbi:MAG: hypothetical protein HKN51_07135 [Saprospiraceae bacterium]|nr:hypothetical protein [Bacteroidia bacterium]NNE14734.1 hypothetical protein [Saprospiraceae bacterium]